MKSHSMALVELIRTMMFSKFSQPTKEQAFQKLLPRTHNGAVILLHSTSKTNAEILDELLTKWEAEGYTFAPIDRLFS